MGTSTGSPSLPITLFLPIGQMVQTITNNLTLGSINGCVLTQPRARPPAPRVNATSRVPTDSLLTTSTAPAFGPLLCLLEPLFSVFGRYVVRFLDNPGPALIDVQNPPMIRRSTPPVALGASKHTAASTRFKASYMVNNLAPFVALAAQHFGRSRDFCRPHCPAAPGFGRPPDFCRPRCPAAPGFG